MFEHEQEQKQDEEQEQEREQEQEADPTAAIRRVYDQGAPLHADQVSPHQSLDFI